VAQVLPPSTTTRSVVEVAMFGFRFGKVPCFVCDEQVARKNVFTVREQRGFTVCRPCLERWRARGGTCPECQTPLRGAQEPGIFLEGKRAFGHADCGALRLIAS
jgi:hypothetical protein